MVCDKLAVFNTLRDASINVVDDMQALIIRIGRVRDVPPGNREVREFLVINVIVKFLATLVIEGISRGFHHQVLSTSR